MNKYKKAGQTKTKKVIDSIPIGSIYNNRKIIDFEKNKHNKTVAVTVCLLCGLQKNVLLYDLKRGIVCKCSTNEKRKNTVLTKYNVNNVANLDIVQEKILNTRLVHNKNNQFRSTTELEIESFINELGFNTIHFSSGKSEIDIFVPEKRVGIEVNGLYWHSQEKGKTSSYHINKKLQCLKDNIELITLWTNLWDSRKEQVKNFLTSKLNKNKYRIPVRKCIIKELTYNEAKQFIDSYHIQPLKTSIILAYGAYYNNECIAVVSFAKHHRDSSKITLNRLCSKAEYTCIGFLGKTVKMAYNRLKQPIYTWVDRCWSEGSSYLKAGFVLDKILKPDYFYYKAGYNNKIISKQSFRKIDERTESQRAKDEKLYKIWDCGKIRFVYKN